MSSQMEFAPTMLRGVTALADAGILESDLALELGLSAWMRQSDAELEEALAVMQMLRRAILNAAGFDVRTEPIPMTGRSAKADLMIWAVYLTELVHRAAGSNGCEISLMVERSIEHLAA
jgi:hypothetical protein